MTLNDYIRFMGGALEFDEQDDFEQNLYQEYSNQHNDVNDDVQSNNSDFQDFTMEQQEQLFQ